MDKNSANTLHQLFGTTYKMSDLEIMETPEAVREYNRLTVEGRKVNALIHTTC